MAVYVLLSYFSDIDFFHSHRRVSDPPPELHHLPVTCPLDVEKKPDSKAQL